MLTIKIYDENRLRANTFIGSASISLKGLATTSLIGNNINFPIDIFCLKNELVGKVTILCGLHKNKNNDIEKKELKNDVGFSRGVFHVNKIVGKEIKGGGGGLFSASIGDLTTYIVLSMPLSVTPSIPLSTPTPIPVPTAVPIPVPLAIPLSTSILHTNDNDNSSSSLTTSSSMSPSPSLTPSGVGLWNGKTGPKTGHTPVWDNLDFKPSVTRSALNECVITAECWAKTLGGVGGDKSLGTGTVSMISAGVSMCVCMWMGVCVCVFMCMCMYVRMCVCMYAMYVCTMHVSTNAVCNIEILIVTCA